MTVQIVQTAWNYYSKFAIDLYLYVSNNLIKKIYNTAVYLLDKIKSKSYLTSFSFQIVLT